MILKVDLEAELRSLEGHLRDLNKGLSNSSADISISTFASLVSAKALCLMALQQQAERQVAEAPALQVEVPSGDQLRRMSLLLSGTSASAVAPSGFWMRFWSKRTLPRGGKFAPKDTFFVTGTRYKGGVSGPVEHSVCVWVQAPSVAVAEAVVRRYYKVIEFDICEPRAVFEVGDRFPNARPLIP